MKIGVDYYPEQWDSSLWETDVEHMKEAGVTIVRLAEFAWSRLEPQEGVFDFSWLDQVISLFQERQIEVFLCTPTCTPPQWMFHKYPEIIQMDKMGRRIATGIRGHRCMSSQVYRAFCEKIITAMVSHYRDWGNVIGYQIDNELEANHCCCPVCEAAFRDWVRRKYKSIEAVNDAYGNVVWSGEYSSFSELKPPLGEHPMWLNPSLHLDFERYASDSTVDYVRFQTKLIRRLDAKARITTNTWLCEHMPDFYDLFDELDFVSYDNYPTAQLPKASRELYSHAFHLDLMRGIQGKPFWIMEQLSGIVGSWMPMGRLPQPGMLRGYSLQAIAHGADAVLHFRWRTAKAGAEMYWHGILDTNNVQGRRYQEFQDLCRQIAQLSEVAGAMPHNQVALLYASEQEYAFRLQHQAEGMYYFEQLKAWHDAFTCLGIGVDIINQTHPFESYQVVIAPTLLVHHRKVEEQLYAFAKRGGTVILTNRCGVKDETNQSVMEPLPSVYSALSGVMVSEYDPLGEDWQELQISDAVWKQGIERWRAKGLAGKTEQLAKSFCTRWADLLSVRQDLPDTAEVLAAYADHFYQGTAAVTRHCYEAGICYYVGTVLQREAYISLAEKILKEQRIQFDPDLPVGIEITERKKGTESWRFLFNNTDQIQEWEDSVVFQPGEGMQLVDGVIENPVRLQPFEMKILHFKTE